MTSMMISHKHYVTRLFSNRDYRVVDHRVSGLWGVSGVIFSYFIASRW